MSEIFFKDGYAWRNIGVIRSVSLTPDVTQMSIVTTRSGMFSKVAPHLRDAYVAGQKKAIPSYDQLTRRLLHFGKEQVTHSSQYL